ncbi:MAG: DUF2844 domain-containing protein [Candidatus Binataceae bacterium]
MTKSTHAAAFAFIALALLFVGGSPTTTAYAALGETADSITADAASFNAVTVQQVARPALNAPAVKAYTVEQMTIASGIAVKEYVSPNGRVFAVTWRGRRPPDLAVLLGSYFTQYKDAANAGGLTAHGLHHASVRGSDVTVETAGHMRDMWGRALLPAMLPPGVEQSEIQ